MTSPGTAPSSKPVASAILSRVIAGAWVIGTTVGSSSPVVVPLSSVTGFPPGSSPVTVAWLVTSPAVMSAWVIA